MQFGWPPERVLLNTDGHMACNYSDHVNVPAKMQAMKVPLNLPAKMQAMEVRLEYLENEQNKRSNRRPYPLHSVQHLSNLVRYILT